MGLADHQDFSRSTGSAVLDDVAEVIGREAALALSWRFRGQDVYIPKDLRNAPEIAQAIGRDAAGELSEHFHGTTLSVPRGPGERAMVLKLAHETQLTRRGIADQLGIGERKVYRILGRDKDDRQGELSFG